MSFYIQISDDQKFSEIFEMKISQKEGELATAKIKVLNDFNFSYIRDKCVSIMMDDEVLFVGKALPYPDYTDNKFAYIQFIANYNDNFDKLMGEFEKAEQYNPLFVKRPHDAKEITEAAPVRFYFDKKSGEVKISNIIDENYRYEITSNDYWLETMESRICRKPISKMNVSVVGQWIHDYEGSVNLFPIISSKFKEGKVNSFNNLERQWWRLPKSLPKSCYSITCSHIREIYPPGAPNSSTQFVINDEPVRFKRFWFDGILDLRWHYRQKIEETMYFSITNGSANNNLEKSVQFRLGAIDTSKNFGSFFTTEEGCKSLSDAARRAFNYVLSAQRNIEVSICGSLEKLRHITVNDSVLVRHHSFDGGYVIGKVVHTLIAISDKKQYVKLKIAACQNNVKLQAEKLNDFFKKHFDIDEEKSITAGDIVEDITINNPPEFQMSTLAHNTASSVNELKYFLLQVPTSIKIKLKNLNTVRNKQKVYHLPVPIVV